MKKQKRQNDIINLLHDKQSMSVKSLAEYFKVTPASIRRDLKTLEYNNFITHTHGFARICLDKSSYVNPFTIRSNSCSDEKLRIAKAAAKFVSPNSSIVLDSGTTIHELALELSRNHVSKVSVISNSLPAAIALANNYSVSLCGGILESNTMALIGPEADDYFFHITVDVVFIGCTGAPASGLTTNSPFHVSLKRKMVNCAQEVIALIDSSKFNVIGTYVFCEYNSISTVVTVETENNRDRINDLIKSGVKVILA